MHEHACLTVKNREIVLARRQAVQHQADVARVIGVSVPTCHQLGIRRLWTAPHSPRTDGKAGRFIQIALHEWAYAATYQNSTQRTLADQA